MQTIERLAQRFGQLLEVLMHKGNDTLAEVITELKAQYQQQQQRQQQALMAQKVKGFKSRRRS